MSEQPIWGCDWTWRNGICPAQRIQRDGLSYVWLKCTGSIKEGAYFSDPCFQASAERVLATNLIPGAYHYLMPGDTAGGQAAHFSDHIRSVTGDDSYGWLAKVNIEHPGITTGDIMRFCEVWENIEKRPLFIYSNRLIWTELNNFGHAAQPNPYLEEAHWIANTYRQTTSPPSLEEQYKRVNEGWWSVNYGGWDKATMLQFTNYALIAGIRVSGSAYRGSKDDLQAIAQANFSI